MSELTTFQKCVAIRNALLRAVAESTTYKSWGDGYKLDNINGIKYVVVPGWVKEHGSFDIDPNNMSSEELTNLGFSMWDEDSKIRLIPLWLYNFLSKDAIVLCINGESHKVGDGIDSDHRFGCIAYGVIPKR